MDKNKFMEKRNKIISYVVSGLAVVGSFFLGRASNAEKPELENEPIKVNQDLEENPITTSTTIIEPNNQPSTTQVIEIDTTDCTEDIIYTPYRVSAEYLNIRNNPTFDDNNIVTKLSNGEKIYAIHNSISDGVNWGKIKYYDAENDEYLDGYCSLNAGYVALDLETNKFFSEENNNIIKAESKMVDSKVLNVREDASTNNKIIGKLQENNKVKILKGQTKKDEERTWQKILYTYPDRGDTVEGWVASEYLKDLPNIYGYKEVNFTDEDIDKIVNFTMSWENQGLYQYLKDPTEANYSNIYARNYVTEDGKNYICYHEPANGSYNYGFGINIYQNGYNNQTVELFNRLGHPEITDPQYIEENATFPREVVDRVNKEYILETIKTIQKCLREKNINFSKREILGLTAISYQFGRDESFVNRFISLYEENDGNTNKFRENFCTVRGTYIFNKVDGGDILIEGKKYGRAEAYWEAFHNGKYIMGAGEEQFIDIDNDSITNNNPNTSRPNNNTTNPSRTFEIDDYER